MTAVYTNAQSILKKLDELRCYAAEKRPDVIMLTKTWTNSTIDDDFLKIHGYETIARSDREDTAGGRGGGIVVYARKEISCWKDEGTNGFNQSVSFRVKLDNEELSMHVVYRSPNSTRENDEALCSWLRDLSGKKIIFGDFNFPGIDWEAGRSDAKGRDFYNVCADTFLEQQVKEATHINGNRLDLVLTNITERIQEVRLDGRLGQSDHEILAVKVKCGREKKRPVQRYKDFNRANYREAREKFSKVDWEMELRGKGVNEMWERIQRELNFIVEECVPWKEKKGGDRPKWYNREVKVAIRKKRNAWNHWKKTKRGTDKEEYKKLEKEAKKIIWNRKKGLEKCIAKESKKNPKGFYSYINSGKNMRNKVGPLKVMTEGVEEIVVDPKRQAEILNDFYASVFTRSSGETPVKERGPEVAELGEICMGEERVKSTIERLRDQSAPGPDGIPNKLLKEMNNVLSHPLSILFSKSIQERAIPDEWRNTRVTPIYKKGPKSDPRQL